MKERGPELVTPIGIAIAAKQNPVQYVSVHVNDQLIRLFDMKRLTVGDCLLASGIPLHKLYGKPGMALIVTVNGQTVTIPGTYGQPPVITKNGALVSLDAPVQDGDQIIAEKGKDGDPASIQLKDLIDELPRKTVTINGERYEIKAIVYQNGHLASLDDDVHDRDVIVVNMPETIEELLAELHLSHLLKEATPFTVRINDAVVEIKPFSGALYKNRIEAKPSSSFEDGDVIEIISRITPTVRELAEAKQIRLTHSMPVRFNGEIVTLSKTVSEFYHNGQLLKEDDIVENGATLELIEKKPDPFIFQDIFNYVQVDIPTSASTMFTLLKNGEPVTFYEPLAPGDHLEILWENVEVQ